MVEIIPTDGIQGERINYKQVLLSPIKIGERNCLNRFFIQAMEGCDADAAGNPTPKVYERYENLFRGEAGLISLEAISITDKHLSRLHQLSIMPANQKPLADFVAKVKAVNPKLLFIFQVTHAGESSNPEFSERVAVKHLRDTTSRLLNEEEVNRIMDDFVLAAKIAHDVGADGIDLKLCHGYLGSQILRPFNDRQWKYGGPWENRRRFAFELYERITKEVNDRNFLLGSKISAWEGSPGGMGTASPDSGVVDLTEVIDLIKGLEARGGHYFIQSAGGMFAGSLLQPNPKYLQNAYLQQTFAKAFRDNLKPDTVVIGSGYSTFSPGKVKLGVIEETTFQIGARNISRGYVDMIGLGRQSFADPLLPRKLREGRGKEIKWCTVCDHCSELQWRQQETGCATYNRYYIDKYKEFHK